MVCNMVYVFEYFLILSVLGGVVCLSLYWPVAACLWLVATALMALPFISFSQGSVFAYIIAMISLSGVFVLLLYMCLLSEVVFVKSSSGFWVFSGIALLAYVWGFSEFMYFSWQNCADLYSGGHVVLLSVELLFLLLLLFCSAIIMCLHGPSREA